jgi:glyoxylase-like metal-dependent hydrolase (beta-lactamase superfamily II)
MRKHKLLGLSSLIVIAAAVWLGGVSHGDKQRDRPWSEVAPGIWRSSGSPARYALVDQDTALLVYAPLEAASSRPAGVKKIETVLLTHHHRDTCQGASQFLADGVRVQAPKASAEWLTTANVRKYWQESLPLRNSRTAYLVVPGGIDGIDCSLEDGQTIAWHGWDLQVVASPGHSRDHVAFLARRGKSGPLVAFCGDAIASPGKIWSPYTTDWDHWTDAGLTPTAQSLRKLAKLKPDMLLPAHGKPILADAVSALEQTAAAVEEMAFLKSFERFTKHRLGQAPSYAFLAKDQVASAGEKPWTRVSEHLFITGNTYVLTSRDNAFLVVDPWGQRSADQIAKLGQDRQLGPLEVVLFSHAHYDHYDGIYLLPDRDKFQVWSLDQVALPLAEPGLLRAPFLDPRPVHFDRRIKDGGTLRWREYQFRFHHLPGQTEFTMGVETVIDGKRCYFTADNFFHQDQFSGTGGWMGLNRSYPLPYAASAKQVLEAAPEWVLAEHGGPFEFSAEDFRRRIQWGQVSARAADAISPSGHHRRDWDPHRIHVERRRRRMANCASELLRPTPWIARKN